MPSEQPESRPKPGGPAEFRFYGPLNDFLPAAIRETTIRRTLDGTPAVKDVVEAIGIPHPEIGLIVANGEPVTFAYRVSNGDRVAVYPPFRSIELGSLAGVAPPERPAATIRFVVDGHLGRLAAYLRMCGFDTAYDNRAADAELARRSAAEDRVLLTRDRGLLKRGIVARGRLVRSDRPHEQLIEVIERFDLAAAARPFGRCLRCNGELEAAERTTIESEVPPRVFAEQTEFRRCERCRSIYWRGSHHARMVRLLQRVLPEIG
jgi:hypothetical protein